MRDIPLLKAGDSVAIVATARKVSRADLTYAIEYLKKNNLEPVIGSSIGLSNHQMAGTDKERASDLMKQILSPKVKAIWCAKGGYGSVRILPYLDAQAIQNNPKFLIGYSDVTALHAFWHQLGLPSIHGQMAVGSENKSEASLNTIFNCMRGEELDYSYTSETYVKNGVTEAPIVGGNLSMIYSICGSSFNFDTRGKILFLEDLDEYLYHIDRMMMNLKNNKLLDHLAGLVVGGMSDMNDNEIPYGKTAEAIIWEHVKDLNCPIAFGFPAGHITNNKAFIHGQNAMLEINHTEIKFKQSIHGST
ncbi:MAG: LD-carboxypeptidase [Flavobacteriaceae bacterium]|nr:LD-carboxypeptidase [Flavobacteriaceae bacterium]